MKTNEIITLLAANIKSSASYILARKFGTTLKAQQDIDVYHAYFRVIPPDHPDTQYISREAIYLVATMFYRYRNNHDVETKMNFEDALHIGYAQCNSDTSRKNFERLFSQTPGTPGFNRAFFTVCRLMEKRVNLADINYAKLLDDIQAWQFNRNVIIRWSRVMHKYTPDNTTKGNEQ